MKAGPSLARPIKLPSAVCCLRFIAAARANGSAVRSIVGRFLVHSRMSCARRRRSAGVHRQRRSDGTNLERRVRCCARCSIQLARVRDTVLSIARHETARRARADGEYGRRPRQTRWTGSTRRISCCAAHDGLRLSRDASLSQCERAHERATRPARLRAVGASARSRRSLSPRGGSAPAKRRARERVGESEGQSPSGKTRGVSGASWA